MKAPVAKKILHISESHGTVRTDDYFWMKDRKDPEVLAYLRAENEYTNTILSDVEHLKEKLYHEMVARIKQTDISVPYKIRGYFYYTRYEEGKEYPLHCRKKDVPDALEEFLIDVNELAEGQSFCDVSGIAVSVDNNLIAYGLDIVGRRLYTIYIKDLCTGKVYPETLENTTGIAVWANDNLTLFYTGKNTGTLREEVIMKHLLNTSETSDAQIFFEADETFITSISKTKSEKYLMIASSNSISNEYQFLDANNPDSPFTLIQKRERNLEYEADHFGDKFYIRTNWGAVNFRLMETPVVRPDKENWKEVIPYQPDVLLDDFEIFSRHLVIAERKNASNHLRVIHWESKEDHYISFDEKVYAAGIDFNPDFNSEMLRFHYSSLTTPLSVYEYDMNSRKRTLLKRKEVLGNFEPENYTSERLFATAQDGNLIPLSIVYRKGTSTNGQNPLLLYGYGSYGLSIDPQFSLSRLSLLDRGFIFAIAHIRGGEEMGRHWYENGKLLKKKNTFTDFIACAEYLIQKQYTNSKKLYAMGGSAGGLLMGAVVNMRSDLFHGIIADVPFVDVINTMLDETIPLTTGEYEEWGNPANPDYYNYMMSYSPYDNVVVRDYPNMLVETGLHDSQVQYWEPAKWVAKLRVAKTDNNLLLLHTNMTAGHGGSSGRFEQYKDIAREFAFLLKLEGITR